MTEKRRKAKQKALRWGTVEDQLEADARRVAAGSTARLVRLGLAALSLASEALRRRAVERITELEAADAAEAVREAEAARKR